MNEKEFDNVYGIEDFSKEDIEVIIKIQKDMLESYLKSKDDMPLEILLKNEYEKSGIVKSGEEIKEISTEIIKSLERVEEMKKSQKEAYTKGITRDEWLSNKILESLSYNGIKNTTKYLSEIEKMIEKSNLDIQKAVNTKASNYLIANQNPNLDGFIAEQMHVSKFNINSAIKDSSIRAEIPELKPNQTYTKNGFDVVIKDETGKRIGQAQLKYGADAKSTIAMIKKGNYSNQTLLVPAEQVEEVKKAFPNKTVSAIIDKKDISSSPLTKVEAKELQEKVQSGENIEVNWNNSVSNSGILKGIAKQSAYSFASGMFIGAGIDIVTKYLKNEKVESSDVAKNAIITGSDFGVKSALAGGLKVGLEKIGKSLSSSSCANIAFIGIENIKIFSKVGNGELTSSEAIYEMGENTASSIAAITSSSKLASMGVQIGLVLGPVGSFCGGLIGGITGYMAGKEIFRPIIRGGKKTISSFTNRIKNGVKKAWSGLKNILGF